jgi:hypothetical protein
LKRRETLRRRRLGGELRSRAAAATLRVRVGDREVVREEADSRAFYRAEEEGEVVR